MYNLAKCDVNAINRSVAELDKSAIWAVMHVPSMSKDPKVGVPGKREAVLALLNKLIDERAKIEKPAKKGKTPFENYVALVETKGWRI